MKPEMDLFNQGVALEKLGKWTEALEKYKESLKCNPKFSKSWKNSGSIYSKKKKHDKAILCFQNAYTLDGSAENSYNLGLEFFKNKDYANSLKYLKNALIKNPKRSEAHLVLAATYQHLDNDPKTLSHLKAFIKLNPKNKTGLGALCMYYFERDQFEESLKVVDRYLLLYPNETSLRVLRTEILAKQGNYKDSFHDLMDLSKKDLSAIQFSHSLKSLGEPKNQEIANELYDKTNDRLKEFKAKLDLAKENPETHTAPDAKDAMDLSLLMLFQGKTESAMKYLLYAKKSVDEEEKN